MRRMELTPSGWIRRLAFVGFLVFAGIFLAAGGNAQTEAAQVREATSATTGLLAMKAWSPYLAGAGIGLLSWFAFLLSDHPLGVSTAFAKSSGMIEKALRGDKTLQKKYYQRFEPKIDWEWMLVLGLLIGAFLSTWLSGSFTLKFIPDLWAARFGDGVLARGLTAFGGGVLIGFGARWANGCTSGHALSGTMQLVASSWVAAAGIFAGGVVTALLIF